MHAYCTRDFLPRSSDLITPNLGGTDSDCLQELNWFKGSSLSFLGACFTKIMVELDYMSDRMQMKMRHVKFCRSYMFNFGHAWIKRNLFVVREIAHS